MQIFSNGYRLSLVLSIVSIKYVRLFNGRLSIITFDSGHHRLSSCGLE